MRNEKDKKIRNEKLQIRNDKKRKLEIRKTRK